MKHDKRQDCRKRIGRGQSARCAQVNEFWMGEVFARAQALEAGGEEMIHLEVGRTDFDTAHHIKEAAKVALDSGLVHYTPDEGSLELRRAVADHLKRAQGLEYDPECEILITIGASEGLFLALAAYLEAGDEVLVPSPGYPTYWQLPKLFGARAVPLPCPWDTGFSPDLTAVVPGLTLIIVNTPTNPTGAVWSAESLDRVRAYAQQHGSLVLSDEIYSDIVFDGQHSSIARYPGMREQTVILGGVSKSFSMTGWRVGFAAGPRELLAPISRLHQHNTVCAPSFAQAGAVVALSGSQAPVQQMVSELRNRRDALMAELANIPGIQIRPPAGTFYSFPNVGEFGLSSEEMGLYLVEKAGVVTVPGSLFGPHGEGHVRMSFACSPDTLKLAATRIKHAIEGLPRGRFSS